MPAGPMETFEAVPLTDGDLHHFFGYYEICPWNATNEFHLCLETEFHDRPPVKGDAAGVCIVEVATRRVERLAETQAWNLQQGAMLHWLPTAADRVIVYNERQSDRFVAVLLDIHTGRRRVLPRPISGISPDGRRAASLNYARLQAMRPVVGYKGLPDLFQDLSHPEDDGLFVMDLETGEARLILSFAEIRGRLAEHPGIQTHSLWFNHTVFNPEGTRLFAMVRYREDQTGIMRTMLFTVAIDGGGFRLLSRLGASHCTWRTARHLFGWMTQTAGTHYYCVDDRTGAVSAPYQPDRLNRDGHCSFTRDGRWLLNDAYPGQGAEASLLLWDMEVEERIALGTYASPRPFRGEIRCDLHPRFDRTQTMISFDSIHRGTRQIYLMDVSAVLSRQP